jgi:carboxyl-terminal processing protease
MRDEHIVIIASLTNSPAEQAGLQKGDILLSINGQTVINKPIKQVASLISKTKENAVNLSIARSGFSSPLSFNVERQLIELETVSSNVDNSGYAYLRIVSFNNHTLHDVARNIARLKTENGLPLKGLLIDLRDNPGGILDSAVAISDLFLKNGIIVTTKGRFYDANQVFTANNSDILNGAPIVVLINKGSASAAEILAGALKDNKRATIVGTRSYGKGSVQSLIPLGNGQTALKLTTAKYYTPSGISIDGIGITPDIAITQSSLPQSDKLAIMNLSKGKENQVFTSTFKDMQLAKAQKILEQ